MIVTLLTEHHLEFLSLKEGCTGSSESTLVKMSNCWKSHATAQLLFFPIQIMTMMIKIAKRLKTLSTMMKMRAVRAVKMQMTVSLCLSLAIRSRRVQSLFKIPRHCMDLDMDITMCGSRGGIGGLDPLENHKLYGFL